MASPKSFDDLVESISSVLEGFQELQQQARSLGLFAELRDPLECQGCGLMENVLIGGRLVTVYRHEWEVAFQSGQRRAWGEPLCPDTGLRFQDVDEESWRCPSCESLVHLPPMSEE